MKNNLPDNPAASVGVRVQRLVRLVRCFLFGHPTSAVEITRSKGYHQWGTCSCGACVERDAHIWSDDPWRKSGMPNAGGDLPPPSAPESKNDAPGG